MPRCPLRSLRWSPLTREAVTPTVRSAQGCAGAGGRAGMLRASGCEAGVRTLAAPAAGGADLGERAAPPRHTGRTEDGGAVHPGIEERVVGVQHAHVAHPDVGGVGHLCGRVRGDVWVMCGAWLAGQGQLVPPFKTSARGRLPHQPCWGRGRAGGTPTWMPLKPRELWCSSVSSCLQGGTVWVGQSQALACQGRRDCLPSCRAMPDPAPPHPAPLQAAGGQA